MRKRNVLRTLKISSGSPNGPTGSRAPSASPLFSFNSFINGCAWNARGLCHHKKKLRDEKVAEVHKLTRQYLVIGLLEAHGSAATLRAALSRCLGTHVLITSHVKDAVYGNPLAGAGGIAVLVSRTILCMPFCPGSCFQELVPGRAVELIIHNPIRTKQAHFVFMHNFKLNLTVTSSLITKIDGIRKSVINHQLIHSLIPIKDFNLEPRGALKISLSDATSLSNAFAGVSPPRHFKTRWNQLFDALLEIDFPFPSHVNSTSLTLSRINRIFLGAPKSVIPMTKVEAGIVRDPTWYESSGLSDHAPIFVICSALHDKPRTQQKLKPEWCRHPEYTRRLALLSACITWDRYTLDEQSTMVKDLMRDAALFARDYIFANDPTNASTVLTRLSSIARCVWGKSSFVQHFDYAF